MNHYEFTALILDLRHPLTPSPFVKGRFRASWGRCNLHSSLATEQRVVTRERFTTDMWTFYSHLEALEGRVSCFTHTTTAIL